MTIDIGRFGEAPSPDVEDTGRSGRGTAEAPAAGTGSAEEFLHEQLLPTYVRDVKEALCKMLHRMVLLSTRKLSFVWERCGGPVNT